MGSLGQREAGRSRVVGGKLLKKSRMIWRISLGVGWTYWQVDYPCVIIFFGVLGSLGGVKARKQESPLLCAEGLVVIIN